MSREANAALIHRAWQAVANGDAPALRHLISDKVEWEVTGDTPLAGRHEGFEGIVDFLARLGEEVESFDASIVDTLSSEDRVMIIYHQSASIGDNTLDCDYALLARIEGGQIAHLWSGPLHPEETRRFWAAHSDVPGSTPQGR